jgi:glycosyltransferase involved in cell wall biosynthesis
LRILYVVESLAVGGAEKVSVLLSNLFHKHGHEVRMLVLNAPYTLEGELEKTMHIDHLERDRKFDLYKMRRLSKLANDADIVHCHMKGAYRYTAAVKKIFPFKAPLIFHDHNGDVDLKIKPDLSLKYLWKPKYYIAVCKPLLDWAIKEQGISASGAFVLENTVPEFHPEDKGSRNGKMIMIANFRTTKNIEFAVEVAKSVAFPLDIYGNANDRNYFEKIETQIRESGLGNKVTLITNAHNIRPGLHEYTLAIHTARSESGPLVLLEYMNSGLPFVTYNTGAVVQRLAGRFPEMVMMDFSAEAWAKRIAQVAANDSEERRKAIRHIFELEFSENKYYQECLGIYEKMLLAS